MDHITKYTYMNTGTEINGTQQNFRLLGAFLIGVIVGTASMWMWTATKDALVRKDTQVAGQEVISDIKKGTAQVATSIVQDLDTVKVQLHNDAVVVQNQIAGLVVILEKVVFEEGGWVVIHEGTASHIGNALGAKRFDKGEHSGSVELLRATEVGKVYRAVLYRDNGDREFNLDSDFPFLKNGNEPVLTIFSVL